MQQQLSIDYQLQLINLSALLKVLMHQQLSIYYHLQLINLPICTAHAAAIKY
jgi:hypothetical protein